jgi:hypothetical protein
MYEARAAYLDRWVFAALVDQFTPEELRADLGTTGMGSLTWRGPGW